MQRSNLNCICVILKKAFKEKIDEVGGPLQILVSNDDGIHAPGLAMLEKTLRGLPFIRKVDVVAPDRDRSAASNSLTLDAPLHLTEVGPGRVCVNGTPTDCVHLAITGWLPHAPDMVISGINAGSNLGDDILYSGTVAAAMEGRFLGYPAIAISLSRRDRGENQPCMHFETAGAILADILYRIQDSPLPKTTVLNINVPDLPLKEIKGIRVTRLGHRHRAEPVIKMQDPRGRSVYWVGPAGVGQDAGPGTDFDAVRLGYVSITPLMLDLTHHDVLPDLTHWASAFSLCSVRDASQKTEK